MFRWVMAIAVLGMASMARADGHDDDAKQAELIKAMQEQAQKAAALTDRHSALTYMLGDFDVEMTVTVPGMPAQTSQSKANGSWAIQGRWLATQIEGEFFGQPFQSHSMMGYDSYAKNYVATTVQSSDNAMNTVRGVITDPKNLEIVMYGTIDEYLTGELNKPLKVVMRESDKGYVTEIWDLGIGTSGVKVVEYVFTRK